MANDKHMIDALSGMMKDGERLMCAVFGYVKNEYFNQFAYFGFTETHFLIAYLSGECVTDTERLPIDITSVKIKKSKILKEYTINILFDNKKSYVISAFPEVFKIKSQKENFPKFLRILKDKAKKQAKSLEETEGKKIRWQYFNTYIYMMLTTIPAVPAMIIMGEVRKGNLDIWNVIAEMSSADTVIFAMYGIFIAPFAILSIFNRFSFGKILGVVNKNTLFLENREIPIDDIKEIIYHPRIMARRSISFSYATLSVRLKADNTEPVDIVHFPMYGLREIKKYNKSIKLKCDKYIWFLILCPTVICAVMGFLLG
ncbi:MAG: hypothetical protein E7612_07680 [Ruminococcaceae bacterium]|nr:hypothetical protein [Oscillospiraceae bacterium]